jgi:hypothetical protein
MLQGTTSIIGNTAVGGKGGSGAPAGKDHTGLGGGVYVQLGTVTRTPTTLIKFNFADSAPDVWGTIGNQ